MRISFSLDNQSYPCYTTQKLHNQAQNTPSPKGCHHPYQIQELEQNSENFVKNAHMCSKGLSQKEFKQKLCYCVSRSENRSCTGVESFHCYSHNRDCCVSLIAVLPKQTKMTVQILKICSVNNCSVHK